MRVSRRTVVKTLGVLGSAALGAALGLGGPRPALAQARPPGMPLPEENVEATLKRLFGDRPLQPADGRVKLEVPLIAENGAVVPVTVEADLPMTPTRHVKHIYIIADRNRRPLNAKFTLAPEAGQAFVGTNIRLAESTDVRAVVELSDGTLYMARRHVKVTVGGCGG
jgi:sulfur-oxidizing protein SoxY